ncbi:hypothetical protein CQW23_33043 [Capsicum baccatum]|uniref:Uncharacterized protein n=1 Tax=Capsicum baccatum TaxID=33114 RepID=A0A2G2V2Z8_CAPBA|nr:hypothetical protein CQW23_33043 [Capsicum baccatum]
MAGGGDRSGFCFLLRSVGFSGRDPAGSGQRGAPLPDLFISRCHSCCSADGEAKGTDGVVVAVAGEAESDRRLAAIADQWRRGSERGRNPSTNCNLQNLDSNLHDLNLKIYPILQNPDLELSESIQIVSAQARNRVKELQKRLDELDLREDIAIANKNVYDKVTETMQKGMWESIEQLNAEELTKFEAWLNVTHFNLQHHLNLLENGASSSLGF